ncbi:hypothetical protein DMENIID0001_084160 [Sergentomyia squamirostris]
MDVVDASQFTLLDYSFFVIVFVISAATGLYYAIKTRKKVTSVDDYLLGGRTMKLLPVACSLTATSLSATTLVGAPAEIYAYGTHTWMFSFCLAVTAVVTCYVFLPIFVELKLTSSFKYFELRFTRRIRVLASGLFILTGFLSLASTVYVPALTFKQVTGVDVYVTVTVLSLLCSSYTAIGGFRAVVWTDVSQLVLMIGSYITVAVVGIQATGGFINVVESANRGGRIIIANTNNLNSRSALPAYISSITLTFIYHFGISQAVFQRYLSLPTLREMRISAWFFCIVGTIFTLMGALLGIIIYANYETCDPHAAGVIEKLDQIVPHFIQEKAYLFQGFNGIFIAGIFSASLSTTSSLLNAMSGVIYEDFISQKLPNLKSSTSNRIMKSLVLFLGIIQIGMIFLVERMGMILQITLQCVALNTAALLTLFILGTMFPKSNGKSAMFGSVTAVVTIMTLILGSSYKKPEPTLPFRTDGCSNYNSTTVEFGVEEEVPEDVFWIFRLSYVYFGLVGTLVGVGIGYLTSLICGGSPVKDQRLLATFIRRKLIPEETRLTTVNNET